MCGHRRVVPLEELLVGVASRIALAERVEEARALEICEVGEECVRMRRRRRGPEDGFVPDEHPQRLRRVARGEQPTTEGEPIYTRHVGMAVVHIVSTALESDEQIARLAMLAGNIELE